MTPRIERWVTLAAQGLEDPTQRDAIGQEMDALVEAMTDEELEALEWILSMAETSAPQGTVH